MSQDLYRKPKSPKIYKGNPNHQRFIKESQEFQVIEAIPKIPNTMLHFTE